MDRAVFWCRRPKCAGGADVASDQIHYFLIDFAIGDM